jgi:EpsI family protein
MGTTDRLMSTDLTAPGPWLRLLRQRGGPLMSGGILAAAVLLVYSPVLTWLFQIWSQDKEYSHGFLVPLISGYLVWSRRECLARLVPRPRPVWGALVMLGSAALLVAGRAGGIALAEAISLLLMIPGLVLLIWGWEHLKALALPLAYLQFMVPWMEELLSRLHPASQLLSADIAVWLLQVMGITALQDGTYIHLPNVTLLVAQECSGVKFLMSIVAIGIPLVYFTQRTWWRGAAVILAGASLAMVVNGARVAMAAVMARYYGTSLLHGPAHIFQGWLVAQAGIVILFVLNWAVCKLPSREPGKLHERWSLIPAATGAAAGATRWPVVCALGFLIALGTHVHAFAAPRPVPPQTALGQMPYAFGDWFGMGSEWIKGEQYFPGVDAQLVRTYRGPSGTPIHLYVGYFQFQRQDKSLVNFHASALREDVREIAAELGPGGPPRVSRSTATIGGVRYVILSWYRLASGDVTGRLEAKSRQVLDALLHGQNNGAVILVAMPLDGKDQPIEPDTKALVDFAGRVNPALRKILP